MKFKGALYRKYKKRKDRKRWEDRKKLTCSFCENPINRGEYDFSIDNFHKALCRKHQPTPQAMKLGHALEDRGLEIEFERYDGHKHIDIFIPKARLNLEVDGSHHHYNAEQGLSDLQRALSSSSVGYETYRITNPMIENPKILEKTVNSIRLFVEKKHIQGFEIKTPKVSYSNIFGVLRKISRNIVPILFVIGFILFFAGLSGSLSDFFTSFYLTFAGAFLLFIVFTVDNIKHPKRWEKILTFLGARRTRRKKRKYYYY